MDRRGKISVKIDKVHECENISTQCIDQLPTVTKPNYEDLQKELDFYRSLFKTHHTSCVFNLRMKTKNGKKVWVDPVNDSEEYIRMLDKDEEVDQWLQPVRPSR
tara:strand:+ start:93 stop:404 length:312 start_codon:yes stop_codon:yes gene_type:complete